MWRTLVRGCWGLVGCLALSTASGGEADRRLDVYWIDVEGGAATLIVTPRGESILVDTGNPGRRDADRIVKTAAQAGLRRIDYLVTTHYHRDHFGGAAALAELIPIGAVYDNGEFEGQRERPDKEYLEMKCERRAVISPGDELPVKGGDTPLSIRCLAARQKFVPIEATGPMNTCCQGAIAKPIDNSDNANSVVLLVSFGPFRFFDAGDLTWNVEKDLVCPHNRVGKVDVMQVTHHGLDGSNNPVLIRTLNPAVAIMNNGVTKGCGPETFTTIQGLSDLQAMYQVHKNLRDDQEHNVADEYIANLEKECQGNVIRLSVDPAGKTYTVSLPATGHARTFQTK